jgi:hypothetical protein
VTTVLALAAVAALVVGNYLNHRRLDRRGVRRTEGDQP